MIKKKVQEKSLAYAVGDRKNLALNPRTKTANHFSPSNERDEFTTEGLAEKFIVNFKKNVKNDIEKKIAMKTKSGKKRNCFKEKFSGKDESDRQMPGQGQDGFNIISIRKNFNTKNLGENFKS